MEVSGERRVQDGRVGSAATLKRDWRVGQETRGVKSRWEAEMPGRTYCRVRADAGRFGPALWDMWDSRTVGLPVPACLGCCLGEELCRVVSA